jgi:hypothetical protein
MLVKGLNFAVTNTVSNLGMVRVCMDESARYKHPSPWVWSSFGGFDVCWKNQNLSHQT